MYKALVEKGAKTKLLLQSKGKVTSNDCLQGVNGQTQTSIFSQMDLTDTH